MKRESILLSHGGRHYSRTRVGSGRYRNKNRVAGMCRRLACAWMGEKEGIHREGGGS